jgi:aldehyde:ferredoxin oxidoreductase
MKNPGECDMNGWMGKLLFVNLTTSEIHEAETQKYAAKYLGGRGLGAAIYWEKIKPETRAFDPENCLIFTTGPMVATGTQGATLTSVVGKSPATFPEGYCYGNLTGFFGAELKKAGYDGVAIEGRAKRPVYLWINDGKAEIKDAAVLWGNNGYKTGELLQQIHGEKTRFLAIGTYGEHLGRTALALASHDCTVSAGFGGVMGSKNLKAIAILGSGKVSAADPEALRELNKYTIKISKRVRLTIPPHLMGTPQAGLLEVIGKGNCYLCGFECVAGIYKYGGRLVGHRKGQSVEYYLPWAYGKKDEPLETFFDAPTMANDYGFDSWEMTSVIDWLYDCYQAGIFTEKETGLPLSQIGTREFLEKLMHAIAYREGFGDILAEGLWRAGGLVSPKAKALFRRTVAPIDQYYLSPPRVFPIMGLLYPIEPRIHHLNYHEIAFVYIAWSMNHNDPGSTPMTSTLLQKIGREFWGSEAAADFSSLDGKALAAKRIQNRTYLKEILGLCDWGWPIVYSFNTPDGFGDPDLEKKVFHAVTGLPMEDLDIYCERVYDLQRMILLREGRQTPAADYPLEYNFTEPLTPMPGGEGFIVPGPGCAAVDMTGHRIDKAEYTRMLQEYYALRGWDKQGRPTPKTLKALDMAEIKL